MFHIHVVGTENNLWLSGYDGCKRSNEIMGKWFGLYKSGYWGNSVLMPKK